MLGKVQKLSGKKQNQLKKGKVLLQ